MKKKELIQKQAEQIKALERRVRELESQVRLRKHKEEIDELMRQYARFEPNTTTKAVLTPYYYVGNPVISTDIKSNVSAH